MCAMDWAWAVQLLLAVTSVVWDRRNELNLGVRDAGDDQENGLAPSSREPRFAAVPPGAPITIGQT